MDLKGIIFLIFLLLLCAVSIFMGFNYPNHHPHFSLETNPLFFAIFGFVSFSFIVLVGQHLRKIVTKKEDYYDDRDN